MLALDIVNKTNMILICFLALNKISKNKKTEKTKDGWMAIV